VEEAEESEDDLAVASAVFSVFDSDLTTVSFVEVDFGAAGGVEFTDDGFNVPLDVAVAVAGLDSGFFSTTVSGTSSAYTVPFP